MSQTKLKNPAIIPVFIAFLVGLFAYSRLPDKVATHWGLTGQVDGWMNRFWGVWLLPLLMAVLYIIFIIIPKVDPKAQNIEKFRSQWHWIMFSIEFMMLYVFSLMIFWNLGHTFNFARPISVGLGVFFIVLGVLIRKAEQNWFIGIRTPWTLENNEVWKRTHGFAGRIFVVAGVGMCAGFVWPTVAYWIVLGAALFATLGTVIYSYVTYKKLIH